MKEPLCSNPTTLLLYIFAKKRKLGVVGVGVGLVSSVDEREKTRGCWRWKNLAHVDEMVYKAGCVVG